MSGHISNEHIAASVRSAEELIHKLDLTEQERAWAKDQAKIIFKRVTESLLNDDRALSPIRALAVPAALAYALAIASDWADASDNLPK